MTPERRTAIGYAIGAGTALVLYAALRPHGAPDAIAAEHARARAFLAALPPIGVRPADGAPILPAHDGGETASDGDSDIDGDGLADCWRVHHTPDAVSTLTIWRGCTGSGDALAIDDRGMTTLAMVGRLASPKWLRWIATQIVGKHEVSCTGATITNCPAPGPEWTWTLAAATRTSASPGWHGMIAPAWQPMPVVPPPATAALVDGARARIIVDAGGPPAAEPVTCAGVELQANRRGVIAVDSAHQRWAWLLRDVRDHGRFEPTALACRDDLALITTGGAFAAVAAVDSRTGGWLFAPPTDGGPGAELHAAPGAGSGALWRDEEGRVIATAALRDWLARVPADRPPLDALVRDARPELDDTTIAIAAEIGAFNGQRGHEELTGEARPSTQISAAARGSLVPRGSCAGFTLSGSGTALLAERGGVARWLIVENAQSPRRITAVRCAGDHIFVTRAEDDSDLFAGTPVPSSAVVEIDPAAGWFEQH